MESTDAGWARVLHSLTSAAADTWTIMNPELSPGSGARKAGSPDTVESTSLACRRSDIEATSVTAAAR